MRQAHYLIDRGRNDSIKVGLLQLKIDTLQGAYATLSARLTEKDNTIQLFSRLETTLNRIDTSHGKEEINLLKQNAANEATIKELTRLVKAGNRKIIFGGAVVAAAVLVKVFILKK